MTADYSRSRAPRPSLLAAPLLTLVCLSGCGDPGYPDDLNYPVRTDLLVVQQAKFETFYPDPPGHLDAGIEEMVAQSKGSTDKATVYDPKGLSADQRQKLFEALKASFGTPADPKVGVGDKHPLRAEVDQAVEALKLGADHLKNGSKLFRRYCLQCHGVPGDGRGPSAPWLNPHPRDYRKGEFKFLSSQVKQEQGEERKPRREDLIRTLTRGVEGTSMPSFGLLEPKDLEDLASYVIHLSLRGQCEFKTIPRLLEKQMMQATSSAGEPEEDRSATVETNVQAELAQLLLKGWLPSDKGLIKPAEPPALKAEDRDNAIRRGYDAASKPTLNCIGCHKDFGRQVNFMFDTWGTKVRPADWTTGVYRGGRRPIDLFWRVRGGIYPSNMPGFPQSQLPDDRVWDIVQFLRALPYPEMLPEDVKEKVYGRPKAVGQGEKKDHH